MPDEINRDRIETLYETRFLKCYDIQYAEGKHYYEASRREAEDLVAKKTDAAEGADAKDGRACIFSAAMLYYTSISSGNQRRKPSSESRWQL